MGIIVFIIVIVVLAIGGDAGLKSLFETLGSCLFTILLLSFSCSITAAAFAINPILGIIVGYMVVKFWKSL